MIVQLLVENARVNCNIVDPSGCTPLPAAATNGYVEAAEVLLCCGRVILFALDGRSQKDHSKAATREQPRFKACLDIAAKV